MGEVNSIIIPQFTGIKCPGLTDRISTRRQLNEPREMYNFHITKDGHLYMPEAADLIYDFSAQTGEDSNSQIIAVRYIETPRGLLVQSDSGRIYHVGIQLPSDVDFYSPLAIKHVATTGTGEEEWPIWTNGISGGTLFGYCPRGSAGPDGDGRTWKLTGPSNDPATENLSATLVPSASYSQLHKGRRIWVQRGRQVYYSPLNEPDSPSAGDFRISGDDSGDSFLTNPGFVAGMVSWEDVLVFFLMGSVWMMVGDSPENWNLRQVQTMVGNVSPFTLVRTDDGVMSYGGSNQNDRGAYLFTGANALKVSQDIDNWLALSPGDISDRRGTATSSGGKYIISTGRSGETNRQFLVYDYESRQWSAFDGFVRGVVTTQRDHIVVTEGPVLYRNSKIIFPRKSGRGARVRLGYMDDENPSGLIRFQAVKLAGRRWGTGTPQVRVTATTDTGSRISNWIDVPTDVFDSLVIPINIRGAAIEFWLEFSAPNDDNEILIENLQLIASRKGEKVSRG